MRFNLLALSGVASADHASTADTDDKTMWIVALVILSLLAGCLVEALINDLCGFSIAGALSYPLDCLINAFTSKERPISETIFIATATDFPHTTEQRTPEFFSNPLEKENSTKVQDKSL